MDRVTGARRTARRMVTPAVFVAVALILLLPFASLRFEVPEIDGQPPVRFEATFAGLTPAVGQRAHVSLSTRSDGGDWREEHTSDARIPERTDNRAFGSRTFTLLALALLAVGLLAAALPTQRLRAMLSAAASLLAALALLAAVLRIHQALSAHAEELLGAGGRGGDPVELRYGFWLAAGLLVVVGFANVAVSVPGPARTQPVRT